MLHALLATLILFHSVEPEPLSVASAISLKDAITDIAHQFESQTGIKVSLEFASSGQLATQIREGAPIDLFISAGREETDALAKASAIDADSRQVIARNRLVLIAPADARDAPISFADATDSRVGKIAIGEPKTVPAGRYASQVFAHLGIGEAIRDRLVYAANVRQVLDYVQRGEVSAGVVYVTDAIAAGNKVRHVQVAEESWHEPIEYPAAIVSSSKRSADARKFLDFLKSDAAIEALRKRGFSVGASATAPSTQPAAK